VERLRARLALHGSSVNRVCRNLVVIYPVAGLADDNSARNDAPALDFLEVLRDMFLVFVGQCRKPLGGFAAEYAESTRPAGGADYNYPANDQGGHEKYYYRVYHLSMQNVILSFRRVEPISWSLLSDLPLKVLIEQR
jgi:hypothetical protein